MNGGLASETRGRIRVEQGSKRIRAYLGNDLVVDTIRPLLVWEHRYYPAYYFPSADVRTELLETDGVAHSPRLGEGKTFTIRAGEREVPRAALRYDEPQLEELRDTLRLDWNAMDAWFEEDEEVFTHPRDPYTRVDILHSSRHVRIEVDGVTIAESTKPTLLFETGLRSRYYLPKTHVRTVSSARSLDQRRSNASRSMWSGAVKAAMCAATGSAHCSNSSGRSSSRTSRNESPIQTESCRSQSIVGWVEPNQCASTRRPRG